MIHRLNKCALIMMIVICMTEWITATRFDFSIDKYDKYDKFYKATSA